MSNRFNLGIVVLNWHNVPSTIDCAETILRELASSPDVEGRIVIVNNESWSDEKEQLNDWINAAGRSDIDLVCSDVNLGFSGGMNLGMHALADFRPDYFWLLNNDLTIEPGSLCSLHAAASNEPGVAIWGPTILDEATGLVQCAGGCYYNRWLGMDRPQHSGKRIEDVNQLPESDCDYIYGAAMMVRADFLYSAGLLNEDYFLFYEELELSVALGDSGKLRWCKGAVAVHRSSKSRISSRASRAVTAYHAALSCYRFTWSHFPACLPSATLTRIVGLTVLAIRDRNLRLAVMPWHALATLVTGGEPLKVPIDPH